MAVFPSKVEFAAFLQYAPRGSSPVSKLSRDVVHGVKQDGYVSGVRIIDHAAKRLSEELPKHPFLADYFNNSVTLVPAPRSAPLLRNALWVPRRICNAISSRGLAGAAPLAAGRTGAAGVLPCIERMQAVQKSATAAPGQRPGPDDHYHSVIVTTLGLGSSPKAITLVDDVITRGSTFLGLLVRLQEAFPGIPVRCFALVRTVSGGEVTSILDPVQGTISFTAGQLSRVP